MFDGMPEQFYQFLAAATSTSRATAPTNIADTTSAAALSLPLSFSLHQGHHHAAAAAFPTTYTPPPTQPSFDATYNHLFHHHHSQFVTRNGVKDDDDATLNPPSAQLPTSLQDGGDTQRSSLMLLPELPWSNDETLALFRIRSSMDNTWFPDFIWENVSRKLAEIGFKRSAEKCKEKFEEETRSFSNSIVSSSNNCNNNNNNNKTTTHTPSNNNNYRYFGELEELCNNNNTNNIDHGGDDHRIISPPPDQSDRPQTSFSQGHLCQDEDNEDDDEENPAEVEADVTEGERIGNDVEGEDNTRNDNNVEEDEQSVGDSEKTEENSKRVTRKRKRQKKFELFKGFCEKIVSKMMAQQEQLHFKILQDMVKRDEEKIAKEEAWKKQEFERLEKVLEVRAHEQAVSGDRQAKILDFLKKFSASSNSLEGQSLKEALEKLKKVSKITSSNYSILSQDSTISAQLQPSSSCTTHDHSHHNPKVTNIPSSSSNENLALPMSSSSLDQASKNPNPIPSQNDSSKLPSLVSSHKFSRLDHTSTDAAEHITDFKAPENQSGLKSNVGYGKDDTGRRWPRDEVLALINIRCSLFNNNGSDTHQDREGYNKGPLWERISQKMMELGYKRSAKRCKEKWENINKYFRKTKDLNKKRSIDSRTCPYYHQLSHLYSQGTLMGSTDRPMNLPGSPENRSMAFSDHCQGNGSSTPPANNGATNTMHASQGNEASVVQVPRFDFEF